MAAMTALEEHNNNDKENKHFFVYMLRCSDGSLYCGWTTDLNRRLDAHNSDNASKRGAKYTRARRPVELVYFEELDNKNSAMKREYEIKQLSRAEKLRLIMNASDNRSRRLDDYTKTLPLCRGCL